MAVDKDVQEFFDEFWAPKLFPEGMGTIGVEEFIDLIKNELYDYGKFLKDLPGFFDEVTGGMASKPNTPLGVIEELVDERIREAEDEAVKEFVDWFEFPPTYTVDEYDEKTLITDPHARVANRLAEIANDAFIEGCKHTTELAGQAHKEAE